MKTLERSPRTPRSHREGSCACGDLLQVCERLLRVANTAEHNLSAEDRSAAQLRLYVQQQLVAGEVHGVAGTWGGDPNELPPQPRCAAWPCPIWAAHVPGCRPLWAAHVPGLSGLPRITLPSAWCSPSTESGGNASPALEESGVEAKHPHWSSSMGKAVS